jgi:hypothetical protein
MRGLPGRCDPTGGVARGKAVSRGADSNPCLKASHLAQLQACAAVTARRAASSGLLAVATALVLAGCAASIGLREDGSYVLTTNELAMDCQRLSNGIWGRLEILKSLPAAAKTERENAAPTAVAAFGRLFGSNGGIAALETYEHERAHVRALHRALIDKGCPPLDVERELAAIDAAMSKARNP